MTEQVKGRYEGKTMEELENELDLVFDGATEWDLDVARMNDIIDAMEKIEPLNCDYDMEEMRRELWEKINRRERYQGILDAEYKLKYHGKRFRVKSGMARRL